jgi:hypothetical protein
MFFSVQMNENKPAVQNSFRLTNKKTTKFREIVSGKKFFRMEVTSASGRRGSKKLFAAKMAQKAPAKVAFWLPGGEAINHRSQPEVANNVSHEAEPCAM